MSTASDVKCGIVYDTNTGEIRRVVNADSKVSMLRGVGALGKNETLLRVERKEYSKLTSSEEVKDYAATKKAILGDPRIITK